MAPRSLLFLAHQGRGKTGDEVANQKLEMRKRIPVYTLTAPSDPAASIGLADRGNVGPFRGYAAGTFVQPA